MTSKYETYWHNHLEAILVLFDQARTAGTSSPLVLTDLDTLGERGSWYGKLEIVSGKPVYDSGAHLGALGAILTPRLPEEAQGGAWIVTVSKDLQLAVQKAEARQTNWFEATYRTAKQGETIQRASFFLGRLTPESTGSAICRQESGQPVYVLFSSQKDQWLAPRLSRLESVAAASGHLVISLTDETSGRFDLWIIPAAELVNAIQGAGFAPSLDRGNAYNFNLQIDEAADMIRQLSWDIRPYRRESGQTELTRAMFWPADGPSRAGEVRVPDKPTGTVDVAARLAQWKIEATDPNHPNHYHADLDAPAVNYVRISALLRKLRTGPESFGRDDVVALFGALNSGQRMKNKVADGNVLSELRVALLALIDGEGEPTTKIETARQIIKYAAKNMLGELYGWANAETAPLSNTCARDALSYLGYPFDPTDYDAFVAAHEQFKQVYLAQVGRLRSDLPLNLEIDKLYNVIDKVDLKVGSQKRQLAKLFTAMFADWDEAQWAFDLLTAASEALGLSSPGDPRATFNLRPVESPRELRLSYGGWLVLRIAGKSGGLQEISLALFTDQVGIQPTHVGTFAQRPEEKPIALYDFPVSLLRPFPPEVRQVYDETLDYIQGLFGHWKRSNYFSANKDYLAQATFDPDKRDLLLAHGPPPPTTHFWKIAPGDDAWQWNECRDNGFIATGWDELGDLSNLDRAGFEARRAEIQQAHPDWTNDALEQVWKFAQIQEGDQIIANRGTSEVLGIGTVTGPYYFVSSVRHGHRLPVQWEDLTLRKVNEGGWRRTLIELDESKFEAIVNLPVVVQTPVLTDAAFQPAAYELLEGLHRAPTKAYCQEHKDELKSLVSEPFQHSFREVAGRLPAPIKTLLETESDLFSIFPKNDYGRGGAWDFYWGAFYPKGHKRTQDAQLHASIRYDFLKFGFSMGAYGSEQRQRFQRNCQAHHAALVNLLADVFADARLVFGRAESIRVTPDGQISSGEACTWEEFLADPARASSTVAVVLPRATVLRTTAEALITDIVQTFGRLFPLVLLATEADPLRAIDDYIEPSTLPTARQNPAYPLAQCADETGFPEDVLTGWVRAIERKGQAILYGPPGTGKTFVAERLARNIIGDGDGFWELVQFHPAYAYEDFIQGIRPKTTDGGGLSYPTEPGRFLEFCAKAAKCQHRCVLIIDEINRANLARVFGELMYLLEYRDREVPLAGGGGLHIPANVRLIGTMNTADRSIALVDHALRRRFAFLALYPNFDVLRDFHRRENTGYPIEKLIQVLTRLNSAIHDRHYHVGITFFLRKALAAEIADIWRMEIEPYLDEYFFDQPDKADTFLWERVQADLQA